jgi:hypothetical protein
MPRKSATSVKAKIEKLFKEPHPPSHETIEDLESLVRQQATPCTCDICQPDRYSRASCARWTHWRFDLHNNLTTNKLGHTVFAPAKKPSGFSWPPQMMHLTRSLIAYFDRPWEYLNDDQLTAQKNF